MRYIFVPHLGQVPVIALLDLPPFPFIATSLGFVMSLFDLHFTQYACVAMVNELLVPSENRPFSTYSPKVSIA